MAFYFLLFMKWLITFFINILFLILFTPLCCFIVFQQCQLLHFKNWFSESEMPFILKHLWMVSIIDLELMMAAVAGSDSLSHLEHFTKITIRSRKQGRIQGLALYYDCACQAHLIEYIPGQLHSLPFPCGTVVYYLIHILPLRKSLNTFTESSA